MDNNHAVVINQDDGTTLIFYTLLLCENINLLKCFILHETNQLFQMMTVTPTMILMIHLQLMRYQMLKKNLRLTT